jgi:hypothetical protein
MSTEVPLLKIETSNEERSVDQDRTLSFADRLRRWVRWVEDHLLKIETSIDERSVDQHRTLPSFTLFADRLRKWVEDYINEFSGADGDFGSDPKNFHLFDPENREWNEHRAFCAIVFREMILQYISMMRGQGTARGVFKRLFRVTTRKNELITTLQAAEVLWSTFTTSPDLWNAFNSRGFVFSPARLKWRDMEMNGVDSDVLELMKILALMVFVMQPPRMTKGEWKGAFPQVKGRCLAVQREKEHTSAVLGTGFEGFNARDRLENARDGHHPEMTIFGIDKSWLQDDVDSDILLFSNTHNYLKLFKAVKFGDKQVDADDRGIEQFKVLESRMTGCYIEFLSAVIAVLKSELEISSSLQNKILSVLSTMVLAMFHIVVSLLR